MAPSDQVKTGGARAAALRARVNPYSVRPDPTPADVPDTYGNESPAWLGIDWRRHLKTVVVPPADPAAPGREAEEAGGTFGIPSEGTTVNFVELGPPVAEQDRLAIVFVHGLSGCWQNWLEQLPAFADRYRVIALDLPGFGDSPTPDWEISIKAYGELLRGFCDEIGVRDCAVVGNSMGGFVAAEAVVSDPDRFEKLVLASAAGVSSTRLKRAPTTAVARMLAAGAPLAFQLQTRTFRRPRARAAAFKNVFRHPEQLRAELLWEQYQGAMRGEGFAAALGSLAGYDILDRLEDVEVPALIVWGRNDMVVPPADADGFARRLRNSQTVIFDDTGHVPMIERPARFNAELERFLQS